MNNKEHILYSARDSNIKVMEIFELEKDKLQIKFPELYYALLEWKNDHGKELGLFDAGNYFKDKEV